MSGCANSIGMVKNKIRVLQEQAEQAKDRAERLQNDVAKERQAREEAEEEVLALSNRLKIREEALDDTKEKLNDALRKLGEVEKAADESERGMKVIENRALKDEERIDQLEILLREVKQLAEVADSSYEEAVQKMSMVEEGLGKAEDRAECAESKCRRLEEELKTDFTSSKSLEAQFEKYSAKEDKYEAEIRNLTNKLKEAEDRAEHGECLMTKLERTIENMEDALALAKEEKMKMHANLEQTLQDLNSI